MLGYKQEECFRQIAKENHPLLTIFDENGY